MLLSGKGEGAPALYISMQEGHADAVRAYGDLLASMYSETRPNKRQKTNVNELPAPIPQAQLIALLAGRGDDNAPALFQAMQKGHADAVKAYGELLASIPEKSISADQRIALLAGEKLGMPALFVSLYQGHADAVKAYGELVKSVSPGKQADLLLSKISEEGPRKGLSGLRVALQCGHFGAVNELLQLLHRLAPDLSANKRAALWHELKDYEAYILSSMKNASTLSEWSSVHRSFMELRRALGG